MGVGSAHVTVPETVMDLVTAAGSSMGPKFPRSLNLEGDAAMHHCWRCKSNIDSNFMYPIIKAGSFMAPSAPGPCTWTVKHHRIVVGSARAPMTTTVLCRITAAGPPMGKAPQT